MKTILLLCLPAILTNASIAAGEPLLTLQPGKDYAFAFSENARMVVNGPVKVLSSIQNGWVRIEYTPRVTARVQAGTPTQAPAKREAWINLAYVVSIKDWEAAKREQEQLRIEQEQRKAARVLQ